MFSLRPGSAALVAALLTAAPLTADGPARAEPPDLAATTCIARIGVQVSCKVLDAAQFRAADARVAATVLPPGLELTDDGRIAGTPTHAGITHVSLTTGGTTTSVPVVVSDVDYLAVTLSADGKTLRGTRWDGAHVVLHQGLTASDVRGLGIHPNGSVYLLTERTLLRIVRPGQVSVVLDGLQAEAMDLSPSGEIHIASRTEILSLQTDGQVFHRARSGKVMDVLEDDAGDIWTLEWAGERRVLHHIAVDTCEWHAHDVGYSPSSIADNRGQIYVTTNASLFDPYHVVATDHSGSLTTLPLPDRSFRLEYSDLFGLLATDRHESAQLALGAPLAHSQLADPTFQRVAAAEHLTHTE
ncbi:hypothetical protein [Agromyces silvae]|uniref:hypothetical protein n=1 Tax=Agromyces silvae TaxID=3388266 RepID=UPI00280B7F1F|nr:hypothetical protein [Agromyces protaetiae]